jgi:hypothetical protein
MEPGRRLNHQNLLLLVVVLLWLLLLRERRVDVLEDFSAYDIASHGQARGLVG